MIYKTTLYKMDILFTICNIKLCYQCDKFQELSSFMTGHTVCKSCWRQNSKLRLLRIQDIKCGSSGCDNNKLPYMDHCSKCLCNRYNNNNNLVEQGLDQNN